MNLVLLICPVKLMASLASRNSQKPMTTDALAKSSKPNVNGHMLKRQRTIVMMKAYL
jgi:Na+-transporting methylmalonyl-CoA/oxaloacetate decarboxylase gamma subunit